MKKKKNNMKINYMVTFLIGVIIVIYKLMIMKYIQSEKYIFINILNIIFTFLYSYKKNIIKNN